MIERKLQYVEVQTHIHTVCVRERGTIHYIHAGRKRQEGYNYNTWSEATGEV